MDKGSKKLLPTVKGLYVEITSKCNMNCTYCYNSSENTGAFMDFLVFDKICRYAKKMN